MAPSVDFARFELATFTEFSDLGNVHVKTTNNKWQKNNLSFCINVYILSN